MKLTKQLFIWVALSISTVLFYQNCGQQGEIALRVDPAQLGGEKEDICQVNPSHSLCSGIAPIGKVEEYRYIDVKQPQIPDLKIVLILDNSDSMRVSQVNLVNNIEKMFSSNGEGLKDYNSEIFILTTAQLNNIGNKLFKTSVDFKNDYHKVLDQLYSAQFSNNLNQILPALRPLENSVLKTNGLLAGDMVGFYGKATRTPSPVSAVYDTFEYNFYPAYLANLNQPSVLSVKYRKGGSISELVNQLKERVELLNPDNQVLSKSIALGNGTADNIPLSEVVEKESGLCALGRVLYDVKNNPSESLVKKGELATFILVSDEEEHDVAGAECVKAFRYQQPLPGTLYKGVCADMESNVSYEVPDKRDWKLQVKQPYIKYIRQAQEHINGEILKVDGRCGIRFKQTHARLKVNKNSHKVTFSRKIVDGSGNTVVKSWNHDLSFNRINKKYTYTFDRVSEKHNLKFDRISLKHKVSSTRKLTTPQFNVNVSRRLVSKFQSVNYVRKTILTKEGNKKVEVANTGALTINIPGYNLVSSDCTPAWLASTSAIKALEGALSASESYEYTISSCAIANTTKTETLNQDYSGLNPAVCDASFVESIFPKSAMQANDVYFYDVLSCSAKANNVASVSVTSADIAGDVSGVTCDANYASSKDSSKPAVNPAIGQTLSYENVSCTSTSTTALNQALNGNAGHCGQVSDVLAYIITKDGNQANVSYANYSCLDSDSTATGQARVVDGVYAGGSCVDNIKALENNPLNTSYANCSVNTSNVTDANQTISNISGQYSYTDDASLLAYIRVKDGNKSAATVDYSLVGVGYVNKPTYEDAKALVISSIDGKKPGTCDAGYASSKDSAKPALAAGQSLVYYDITCADNTPVSYQLTRAGNTIKYDGSYGNLLLAYDSSLSSARVCTGAEQSTILLNESSASPAMIPDGNVLEVASCVVSNADLVSATTASNNILSLVNAEANVKVGVSSAVCDAPITTHCAVGAANNSGGYLGCENKITDFVTYVAYKAEKRKYVLKAPMFDAVKNELHWFGFEPMQITKNGNSIAISLLALTCEEVVGACGGNSANDAMTVENYFKMTFAGNDSAAWNAIKKTSISQNTISDPTNLAIACVPDAIKDYMGASDSRKDYETCNNKSVNATTAADIAYDTVTSEVIVTKNLNDTVTCNEVCTVDKCKVKSGSLASIPITVTENGNTRTLTMSEFYGNNCAVGQYTASTQVTKRNLAKVNLSEAARDLAIYNNNADVCSLTCKDTGLCKSAANLAADASDRTIKQYLADLNAIDVAKIASCKMVRAAEVSIEDRVSKNDVENSCIRPAGSLLANKYIKNKAYISYYSASLPNGRNDVVLVKEGSDTMPNYITNSFSSVLGDGFVSMASFSSQAANGQGSNLGKDYDDVARSVNGVIKDVKATSDQYGEALKFLGEKVASQLKSSFQVADVAPTQQITRVWYSSWFTKGKYIQLNPTDFSASSSTIVITNPDIIDKMKNEASFKFFVEIY